MKQPAFQQTLSPLGLSSRCQRPIHTHAPRREQVAPLHSTFLVYLFSLSSSRSLLLERCAHVYSSLVLFQFDSSGFFSPSPPPSSSFSLHSTGNYIHTESYSLDWLALIFFSHEIAHTSSPSLQHCSPCKGTFHHHLHPSSPLLHTTLHSTPRLRFTIISSI